MEKFKRNVNDSSSESDATQEEEGSYYSSSEEDNKLKITQNDNMKQDSSKWNDTKPSENEYRDYKNGDKKVYYESSTKYSYNASDDRQYSKGGKPMRNEEKQWKNDAYQNNEADGNYSKSFNKRESQPKYVYKPKVKEEEEQTKETGRGSSSPQSTEHRRVFINRESNKNEGHAAYIRKFPYENNVQMEDRNEEKSIPSSKSEDIKPFIPKSPIKMDLQFTQLKEEPKPAIPIVPFIPKQQISFPIQPASYQSQPITTKEKPQSPKKFDLNPPKQPVNATFSLSTKPFIPGNNPIVQLPVSYNNGQHAQQPKAFVPTGFENYQQTKFDLSSPSKAIIPGEIQSFVPNGNFRAFNL